MEVNTNLVGQQLEPYHVTIDWRRMMNYAAAINDNNPIYFDDLRPEGVVAHPMYGVAVTWPILRHLDQHLRAASFPPEVMATQVHYSEHLRFHRPIKNGDRLTIGGAVAAMLPHRAGTHLVMRLEAVDSTGQPVFTEHIGGLLRGVTCGGESVGVEGLPATPEPLAARDALWERPIHIDPLLPFVYDGCADIFFPIHTSPRFARMMGLPGIILQGTATLALAAREIINQEAGGDPMRLKSVSCQFAGMVPPDSEIVVRLLGREPERAANGLFFEVLNHQGDPAVKGGYAVLRP